MLQRPAAAEATAFTIVGLDLNDANIALARGVFEIINRTHGLPGVTLHLLFGAGGERSGTIRIPRSPPWSEVCRIPDNATSLSDAEWTQAVSGAPLHLPTGR